jgi:predicted transcriptional regulator
MTPSRPKSRPVFPVRNNNLGRLLGKKRFDLDMTLSELEKHTGVPKSTLHHLENGHVKDPTFFTVHKIAVALELHLNDVSRAIAKDRSENIEKKN